MYIFIRIIKLSLDKWINADSIQREQQKIWNSTKGEKT